MRNPTGWKAAAAAGLLLTTAACDLLGSGDKKTETKVATKAEPKSPQARLCAANATYARLKEAAFDEAKRIRERDTDALNALADASIVRMENPLLESADTALGLTVCSGRMILELPPGAGKAFDGRQRLAADVTYSAQAAADGSGTVFKIDGGEPIIYRLAAFDPRGAARTASIEGEGLEAPAQPESDEVAPEPAEAAVPPPAPVVRPAPAPRRPVPVEDVDDSRERALAQREAREAARLTREARARAASAASTASAASAARAAEDAAGERRDRAERVAEARRIERGVDEPRARTARPSFNCRYARSRVERLICGNDDLAARDREMAALFYRTSDRSDVPTRRRLSASRLRFLAYRDRCSTEACVAAAYEDRMDEIRDLADE